MKEISKKILGRSIFPKIFILLAMLILMSACQEKGPLEKTGESADRAVEKAGEAIEDAGDKVERETSR